MTTAVVFSMNIDQQYQLCWSLLFTHVHWRHKRLQLCKGFVWQLHTGKDKRLIVYYFTDGLALRSRAQISLH